MDIEQDVPTKPVFTPYSRKEEGQKVQFRRIPVPQHRLTPLKTSWMQLYEPITKNLKLDMRMNLKTKKVIFLHGL
jgi:RNA-binding protein PNO1